jgi:hypothetical protein
MNQAGRQFRYLADPVCMVALIIYAINRFILKPHHIGGWFTHGYLNDVLCLPLFVPMVLYAEHLVRLRPHFGHPRAWEILQIGAGFTLVFQVIIPRYPETFVTAGDPYDILAYLAGGIVAWICWSIEAVCGRDAAHLSKPHGDGDQADDESGVCGD